MKYLFTLYSVFCAICSLAQTGAISGKVVDNNKRALPFATVYINQTTIGTTTDLKGEFLLNRVPTGEQNLVVSYIGFETFETTLNVSDSSVVQISISLIQSTTNLKEVEIRSKKDARWEAQFERFHKLFFGTTGGATLCKIANPWVLDFKEDKAGRFIAEASSALEIENLSLGYRLTYLLKTFEVGATDFNIVGLVRFLEMQTNDKSLTELWTSRRKQAYYGSPRHLLRSIIEGRVEQEGFQLFVDITNKPDIVRNPNFLLNMNESIILYTTMGKVLPTLANERHIARFPPRLEVHYKRKVTTPKVYSNVANPVSWMEVDGGTLYITKQGVPLNSSRLTVLGSMSDIRVAEILPYDYTPKEEIAAPVEKLEVNKNTNALAGLMEKPYLHLDKPYYYHNEVVFFKAYMSYALPLLKDSLSHVLYVDLIGPQGKTFQAKAFPVVNGSSNGDFFLSREIPEGDYTIRAYTRWMLNYGLGLVFQRPLKILADNQIARPRNADAVQPQGIRMTLDKEEFKTREKISVNIEAIDLLDLSLVAELSVSVTDVEQAVPPRNEQQINTSYPFTNQDAATAMKATPTHLIQFGFPLSGRFISKSKKESVGEVRLFQNRTDAPLVILTDDNGKFARELQVMDSLDLYMEARTLKHKPGRVVLDTIKELRPEFRGSTPVDLEFYIPEDQAKMHVPDAFSNARMLANVTIESKKILPSSKKKPIHVDLRVDNEWLRNTHATDLLSALQRRVPGLRIIYRIGPGGLPTKYVAFTGNYSFEGGVQEPLVILDGVPIVADDQSIGEKLSQMSPGEIENVEVIKFGNAAAYGARSANGVIIITTLGGRTRPYEPAELDLSSMEKLQLPGYASTTDFESPDYSKGTSDDHYDSRSTIYWNPTIATTGTEPYVVSFYAADIPTTYRIVVEGVTADGKPLRGEKLIKVKE